VNTAAAESTSNFRVGGFCNAFPSSADINRHPHFGFAPLSTMCTAAKQLTKRPEHKKIEMLAAARG
jgi:hypothetical protein